jgi:hypothetical protein
MSDGPVVNDYASGFERKMAPDHDENGVNINHLSCTNYLPLEAVMYLLQRRGNVQACKCEVTDPVFTVWWLIS